jgi:hypothetical protein
MDTFLAAAAARHPPPSSARPRRRPPARPLTVSAAYVDLDGLLDVLGALEELEDVAGVCGKRDAAQAQHAFFNNSGCRRGGVRCLRRRRRGRVRGTNGLLCGV